MSTIYRDRLMGQQHYTEENINIQDRTATALGSEKDITEVRGCLGVCAYLTSASALDADNYISVNIKQSATSGGSYVDADSWQYGGDFTRVFNDTSMARSKSYNFSFEPKAGYPYIKVNMAVTGTVSVSSGAHLMFTESLNPDYSV